MKKIIAICAAIVLTAVMVTGCSSKTTGKVALDGSTSMEKVVEFLRESFMEENSDINISYNPTCSGSGIQAVKEGRCDIGLASRDLKEDEKDGLTGTVIAVDGIAVVVG